MTEGPNVPPRDMAEELDELYERIAYRVITADEDEAKARLRRALLFAWSDGQMAGLMDMTHDGAAAQNPWAKPDKTP